MDPVKKTFEEAFNGYEIPVREDLWKQVQAKRQKPERKLWPFLRVAAAAAIVIVAVSLFWQRSQPETHPEVVNAPVEQPINELPIVENTTPGINEETVFDDPKEVASQEKNNEPRTLKTAPPHKSLKPKQIVATLPAQEIANDHQAQQILVGEEKTKTLDSQEEIALEKNFPPNEKELTHLEVPIELTPLPIPPKPMMEQKSNQLRSTADVLNDLKPVFTDRDKTGPERLLAAFGRVKPKVVDDLIAFGNRHTEIEITW